LNTLEYSKFKSLLRRVIAIPLVIMAVLAGLLLWETIDLNKSLRSVDHTDQVLDQTGHLLKMLVDIETSMRGYLATGDESLLQPYREGTQQFDSEYRTLYRLLDDNPPQKLQLEDFRAGYERWVGYTDEVIALRRAGKADGAIYESLPGKRGMDALRERISEFQGVEERVRVQRLRTAHARWTLMFTSCLGLGLGFGVFLILFIRYHVERLGTKLLRSEERWSATLDSIGDAVIATNDKARVTFLNPVAAALTGWQAEEALHQPLPHVFKIVNEETGLGADDEVLRVLEERQIFSVTNNVVLIAKDGREIPVEHSAAPILAGKGKVIGVVLVFRDVTERKRGKESLVLQKEQLRALAERLQWVREEDRKQVARDLHDQIGQILTAIKMDMTWMTRHLPESEAEVLLRLRESIQLINDGVKSVRTICSGLRPGVLDDLGLAAAIEWQASEFASRNGVSCQVSVPPVDLHLDGDRATATFRIFQECLTNVVRHAQAQSVQVTLSQEEERIVLTVEDDGIGFCESDLSHSLGSLGLLGMRERAQFCGGDVHISSSPGKGTTVTVRVPVDTQRAEREQPCTS
jgi:PAS domain S-box-containing protein